MEKEIRTLHLEDDAADAELIYATLESASIPCQITRVQSSDEFSDALRKGGYDLILSDYRLPSYDGISALSFVRERYPDIPFIFISGTMGEDAAIQALTEGATDYVLKQKLSRLAPAVVRALRDAENRTERKHAEEALKKSESEYRHLFDNANDVILIFEPEQEIILEANAAACTIYGFDHDELIGMSLKKLTKDVARGESQISDLLEAGAFRDYESIQMNKSGEEIYFLINSSVIEYRGRKAILSLNRDITGRKHYELEREAIITVSQALRKATTRTEILTVILDQVIVLFEADGSMLALPNPIVGGITIEMGRGVVGERFTGLNIPPGVGVSGWVIANKKPYLNNHAEVDALFYRPDLLGNSHCVASTPLIAQERAIGALWIARQINIVEQDLRLLNAIADIAANAIHRVTLHEQTEQQLHHLMAVHQIDIAISTNVDLSITLNVILNNVKDELEVDSASILLLNPVTHTLDYAAGIGFRTRNIEQSHIKLGDGYAGRAAQEYRTVSCPDLRLERGMFSRAALLADEEFAAHYATPLVVKGQVKGVLELFHRKTLDPTQAWLDYFETLATQAAIAIENASLFENLQRSNMELMLAYDATIEGWSRALDLRDRETEGHTQRVTDMALALAEKMGMSDAEKQDIWRGALLHDIGKMGVPDSILLKPGPLLESEWEIMRQHPLYAYQMLAPVTYLKHALEIPYCHHEKWDGSGYPHGLKGEQIPLGARLFAVVDVWDALRSDRPYRQGWPEEKVREYIRAQAGTHFDLQAVELFFRVMNEKTQEQGAG